MAFIPDSPKAGFIPDNAPPANPIAAIGSTPSAPNPRASTTPQSPVNEAAPIPGSSPDAPSTANLYGSTIDRMKASFGNTPGLKPFVEKDSSGKATGFSNTQKNKDGDLVAQYTDGKWYKDNQDLSHPLNWIAGHTGGALPTGGMGVGAVGGGALAGMAGLPEGPLAIGTGYAGGVAGAGFGSGVGEGIRANIGKILKTYQGDVTPSMKDQAVQGGMAEAIGKPVGAAIGAIPGVKQAANTVADYTIRPALSKLSQIMSLTGVDPKAAMRLLQRPSQVMGSTVGDSVSKTAEETAAELANSTSNEKNVYDAAQNKFLQNASPQISTNNAVGAIDSTLQRPGYTPNSFGYGAFDSDEVGQLQALKRAFKSRAPGTGETGGYWEMKSPQPKTAAEAEQFARNNKPDIEASTNVATNAPVEGGGPPALNTPSTNFPPPAVKPTPPPFSETGDDSVGMGYKSFQGPELGGLQNSQSPQELAGNLQYLRQASKPGYYNAKGAAQFRSDANAGVNASVLGGLKKDLYNDGPAGQEFMDANNRSAKFMDNVDMMKGAENPATAESWASNLFGKNRTATQKATQSTVPQSYEKLADIGAYKSFDSADKLPVLFGPTGRGALGATAAAIGMHGDPGIAATAAVLGTLTHPRVQRSLLNMSGQVINNKVPSMAIKAMNPWGNGNDNQGGQ